MTARTTHRARPALLVSLVAVAAACGGQAEAAAQQRAFDGFVDEAKAVARAVKAAPADERKCPPNIQAGPAPVVDLPYLDALAAGDADAHKDALAVSAFVRSGTTFTEEMLRSAAAKKAGAKEPTSAKVPTLADEELVVVAVDAKAKLPVAKPDGYVGGTLTASIVVVAWKGAKVLCRGDLTAQSADTVKTGGGATLRVGFVPVGTVLSTDIEEAITKDFRAQITAAKIATLRRIHGA